jgi:hypothetical protein
MAKLIAVEAVPEIVSTAHDAAFIDHRLSELPEELTKKRLEEMTMYLVFWFALNVCAMAVIMTFLFSNDAQNRGTDFVTEVLLTPKTSLIKYCFVERGCPDTPETPGGRCGLTDFDLTGYPFCRNPSNNRSIIANAGMSFFRFNVFYVHDENGRYPFAAPCNFLWPALKTVLSLGLSKDEALIDPHPLNRFQLYGADVPPWKVQKPFWQNLCDIKDLYNSTVILYAPLQHGTFRTRHDLY